MDGGWDFVVDCVLSYCCGVSGLVDDCDAGCVEVDCVVVCVLDCEDDLAGCVVGCEVEVLG